MTRSRPVRCCCRCCRHRYHLLDEHGGGGQRARGEQRTDCWRWCRVSGCCPPACWMLSLARRCRRRRRCGQKQRKSQLSTIFFFFFAQLQSHNNAVRRHHKGRLCGQSGEYSSLCTRHLRSPVLLQPYDATEQEVQKVFEVAGPVKSFRHVFDRDSNKAKGFGGLSCSAPPGRCPPLTASSRLLRVLRCRHRCFCSEEPERRRRSARKTAARGLCAARHQGHAKRPARRKRQVWTPAAASRRDSSTGCQSC